MSKGFRIDGHFVPISYDKNKDGKLTVAELSIWCKANDFKYDAKSKKISPAPAEYVEDDIKNLKFNNDKYSLESLKQRYPANKYEIENISGRIFVKDKSTSMTILRIDNDFAGVGQKEIKMYDGYDEAYTLIYDKSGKLLSYQTKDKHGYPIADNINKAVSAKNKLYLPTTDKQNLIKYVKQLSPENIIELDTYYENTYGESLEEAIKNEIGLDKNIKKALLEHLSNCFEKAIGCSSTKYENKNSQIINPYYTGDKFTISCNNNKIIIINANSKQQYNLDLEILLQDFPLREKALLKKEIQNLPAEVLADLAIEIDADNLNFGKKIKSKLFSKGKIEGGSYRVAFNSVTLNTNGGSASTLVHELGHAVDYMPYGLLNLSSIEKKSKFNTTFEKEMSNYINAGYRKYDKSSTEYIRANGKKNKTSNYATASKQEMFAECYALLMTGSCNSQDIIEDYFPETLKVIKTHIKDIHKKEKNERN